MRKRVMVIGSGPAGATAAIYAQRAGFETVMVLGPQPGGQLTITSDVENYPGYAKPISGPILMKEMIEQARNVGVVTIDDVVGRLEVMPRDGELSQFKCVMDLSGDEYIADAVVIATGASAKWLGLESESQFMGYGVSGCATCDGAFFKNQDVMVIGGGNSAVEEALHLTHHARSVTVMYRGTKMRAEKVMQDRLFAHPKVKIIWQHVLEEVVGDEAPMRKVTGAKIRHVETGEITDVKVDGIFVSIGHKPNTDVVSGVVELDSEGYIVTPLNSTKTSVLGIFAAGDVRDKMFRQAVTAAGNGCMAAIEVGKYLS